MRSLATRFPSMFLENEAFYSLSIVVWLHSLRVPLL